MKHIIKYLAFSFVLVMLFNACNKTDNLPYYTNGTATVLTSSVTKVNAAPKDSSTTVLALNWTSPAYATDAKQVKFVIEFDSTGRKFAHSVKVVVSGLLTKSFTGQDFNSILYQLGANPGASYPLDVRVTSSYANNNEPYYSNVVSIASTFSGYVAPVISSSVATTIPIAATTYSSEAVHFNWTNALYTVNNTSGVGIAYTLQLDRAGDNFSGTLLQNYQLASANTTSFTQKDINTYLMKNGYPLGTASNLQFRVIATIGGVATSLVASNVITLSVTPVNKPAIDPPASGTLFIVGSATQGSWGNPVPVPTQQFYKKDSVTYEGVFNLVGGQQYLLLPVNGSWSEKYAVPDLTIPGVAAGTGGAFQYYTSGGNNIPAPAASGWYKILVDFQQGLYTVTPYTDIFPTNLFIVGDATPDSWNNPSTPVNPVFTQIDAANFQVTLSLVGPGKGFLILPVAGSWANKYAVASSSVPSTGGSFGYNLSTNFNGPATSGTYTVTANFFDFTFTVK